MNDRKIGTGRAVALIVVLSVTGALFGCGSMKETPVGGVSTRPEADKKKIELKSDDGTLTVTGETKKLPAGFPPELPIYKPSKLKSTLASEGQGEAPMTMAIFHTDAKAADVAAFYQNSITGSGWAVTNTVNMGQAAVTLTITKGNQVGSVSIGADQDTSGTIISINVAQR